MTFGEIRQIIRCLNSSNPDNWKEGLTKANDLSEYDIFNQVVPGYITITFKQLLPILQSQISDRNFSTSFYYGLTHLSGFLKDFYDRKVEEFKRIERDSKSSK